MKLKRSSVLVAVLLSFVLLLFCLPTTRAVAASNNQQGNYWCGNGYEADNYGFSYDYSQPHWTVGNGLVSEDAMTQVDTILDELNYDELAQTMILVLPEDQVGIATNCAVHFLRYMGLGLPDGPHADNGFAFLFVVGTDKIDVHYAVGLGLPALTAQNLTPLNRLAEDTYKQTGSLDTAIIETIKAYNEYVRSVYQESSVAPTMQTESVPSSQDTSPSEIPDFLIFVICLFAFIVIFGIGFLVMSILDENTSRRRPPSSYVYSSDNYTPNIPSGPTPAHHQATYVSQPSPTPHHSEPAPIHHQAMPAIHISHPSAPAHPTPVTRGGSGSGRSGRTN